LKQFGGTARDRADDVAADAQGNCLVTGSFGNSVQFGSSNFVSFGNSDAFVTKLDSTGGVMWARQIGGTQDDSGRRIAADSAGNIVAVGGFSGTVSFGATNLIAVGFSDLFLAWYNQNGLLRWARQASTPTNFLSVDALAVDANGYAYVAGDFSGVASFGNVVLTNSAVTDRSIFVVKYDPNGNAVRGIVVGRRAGEREVGVAVDAFGQVVIAGTFYGVAEFGATQISSIEPNGDDDVFIAKYDAAGALAWVRQWATTNTDYAETVALDRSGNIYLTGNSRYELFLNAYDPAGSLIWTAQSGTNVVATGRDIAVDSGGDLLLVGWFEDTATFGNTSLVSTGGRNGFIARLEPPLALRADFNPPGLTMSWSTNALSFLLQTTTNLSVPASWRDVQMSPDVANGRYRVTLPMGDDANFFRLRRPSTAP
jgi:beta-propeller repeat-containing protein